MIVYIYKYIYLLLRSIVLFFILIMVVSLNNIKNGVGILKICYISYIIRILFEKEVVDLFK